MKPISFAQATGKLSRPPSMTEEECGDLPVHIYGGVVTSCWKPTLRERLSILFYGHIWLYVYSGKTQPPVALIGEKTVFADEKKSKDDPYDDQVDFSIFDKQ